MFFEPTDAPRHRHIRPWYVAIGVIALTLLTLIVVALSSGGGVTSPSSYEGRRAAYEQALLNNPNRVDSAFGVQIHDNASGAVYTYETRAETVRDKDGTVGNACKMQCLVGYKTASGYAITLPVGFTYSVGEQIFSPMSGSQPVTDLTYWDPQQHKPVTIHASGGGAVALPKVLYRRVVQDVQVGETVYTVPQWVRNNGSHLVLIDQASVWYEPGGSLYGIGDLARLTKTKDGFEVCLPKGMSQLIDDKGAYGSEVHVLNERC